LNKFCVDSVNGLTQ